MTAQKLLQRLKEIARAEAEKAPEEQEQKVPVQTDQKVPEQPKFKKPSKRDTRAFIRSMR